jgi:hypothetical protein
MLTTGFHTMYNVVRYIVPIRVIYESYGQLKKYTGIMLKGQPHEKVCEIMTKAGCLGLN